jgi:hypothetical protein
MYNGGTEAIIVADNASLTSTAERGELAGPVAAIWRK